VSMRVPHTSRTVLGHAPTARGIAAIQAAYYLPTALAPFLSRRGFEAVTGPKLEWWLVQTVGALVGVIGGTLAVASRGDAQSDELFALGFGTAVALGTIDVVHVARRRISPVYLVDAAAELSLAAGWVAARAPAGFSDL
jgi:hypothetical protein